MVVTPSPMTARVRLAQLASADAPSWVTASGISTSTKPLQPWKALVPTF